MDYFLHLVCVFYGMAADLFATVFAPAVVKLASDFVPHMAAALVLGFIIGLERRARHKSIGVRTFMILAGSACMTAYFGSNITQTGDHVRLAAALFSGVSWIGVAITFSRQGGFNSSGVTTATLMIMSVAVGIGCGLGYFLATSLGVGMVISAVVLAGKMMRSNEYSGPVSLVLLKDRKEEILSRFGKDRGIIRWSKDTQSEWLNVTVQPTISTAETEQLVEDLLETELVKSATISAS
jgi:putative Mg2+ transporter-C (MgtC) family protein